VRIRWADERTGAIGDIACFEPEPAGTDAGAGTGTGEGSAS
jgi:hypothetical protein